MVVTVLLCGSEYRAFQKKGENYTKAVREIKSLRQTKRSLLLHHAFRRLTLSINQQMRLHKISH